MSKLSKTFRIALALFISVFSSGLVQIYEAQNVNAAGTYQPVWCHWTGNKWQIQQGASPSGDRHDALALLMTNEIRNAGGRNMDKSVKNGDQVMMSNQSTKVDPSSCEGQIVTVPAVTVNPVCGLDNDSVIVPQNAYYTWQFSGWVNGQGSVTITTVNNYAFHDGRSLTTQKVIPFNEKDRSSCVTTITTLPQSTVTGICGLDNDTITVGVETTQHSKGVITQGFTNGIAKVTYTAKTGFAFANGSSTYTETIHETNRNTNCTVKDATADVTVSAATCSANGVATLINVQHAQLVGSLATTAGSHTATFAADAGHAFANGQTQTSVHYVIPAMLRGSQCAGPKPQDDHQTRNKSLTICMPGGGGTVANWQEQRSRSYWYNPRTNQWEPGLWSLWTVVPGSATSRQATDTECPKPVQVQPTCSTLGTLTLPAYTEDPLHHYTYVISINGLVTQTSSASHDVTVANIPQGATVKVRLLLNGIIRDVTVYRDTFTFDYANCITPPALPAVSDPCGPNNATWIVPADTNEISWSLNANNELIATAIGSNFTNGQTTINFGVAQDSGQSCSLSITKTGKTVSDTNKNGVIGDVGDEVSWEIIVTNTSDTDYTSPFYVQVDDAGAILTYNGALSNGHIPSLAAHQSVTFKATTVLTQSEVIACKATNAASAALLNSRSQAAPLATADTTATYAFTCLTPGKGGILPHHTTPSLKAPLTGIAPAPSHMHTNSVAPMIAFITAILAFGALYFARPKKQL